MNAEFDWWLLFVGIAVGAGLVWFVLADSRRHQEDIDAEELPREALWLSSTLADDGWDVPPEAAERLLRLQREYLAAPPPDAPPPAPPEPQPSPEPQTRPEAEVQTAPIPMEAGKPEPADPFTPPSAS